MKTAIRISLAALVAAASGAALAGAADNVNVGDPYVRMAPPAAMATGAFMTLKNAGDKDAKLVKAESAAAKRVELHNHINEGGVMKMRQVPAIEIKAKGEVALKPGSYHIMMIEPTAPLKEGDKVGITLVFDDGSSKKVDALVKKPEAPAAPAKMDHSSHDHKH